MTSHKRSRANFESDAPPSHAPYALYGTPLPAFDPEVRDDGSFVPVWKQEVTDERGRKRLHGAFTGGWSAGYFNTVGSKEGWAPSTFVSSRTNRAKPAAQSQQRAEDFMDDEDLAEQAESQKLETQGAFAGFGPAASGTASSAMFSDLFRVTGDTIGVKLLQRMGWRQGQGIGPKIRRLAQGDKTGESHEFAPENTVIVTFANKTDRKGLDVQSRGTRARGDDQDNDNDDDHAEADARIFSSRRARTLTRPKQSRKSALGVGVLNDTGSDDEDPYAMGPQIKYNRTVGGAKASKAKVVGAVNKPQHHSQQTKLTPKSVNISGPTRRCHDGKTPLAGFVLSTKSAIALQENAFPPSDVPANWQPAGVASHKDGTAAYQSTADAAKASILDPKARASLLGEQQLPGKSVFDFLTPAARDKLANASGRADLPQARGAGRPEGVESSHASNTLWDRIPQIDKSTALAALKRGATGWMPYAEDEKKRARYHAYLNLQAGLKDTFPERPTGFSTDEWVKEMREFAQAAEVFKPISSLMATRFTTSTSSPRLASDRPDAAPEKPVKQLDPAEAAAKANMYGSLTRVRSTFQPTRLLCKRFGVKPPTGVDVQPDDKGPDRGSKDSSSQLVSQVSINHMMQHANFKLPSSVGGGTEDESGSRVMRPGPATVDASVNDALEGNRPDEGTFKSIFEDR